MTFDALMSTLDTAVFILYVLSVAAFARAFAIGRQEPTASTVCFLWGGFIAHALSLAIKGVALGQIPVMGMFGAMWFIAWSVALCCIFLQSHLRSASLGVFVMPFAVVFAGLALAFSDNQTVSPDLLEQTRERGMLFGIHMATALFSYSCFAIAFAGGLMYLLFDRELHGRHLGFFYQRMPPLETIDKINTHAMGLGLSMLAIGILTGAVALGVATEDFNWGDNAKIATALLIWLVYALNLAMALRGGWRGKRAAAISVANFCLVFALYFVVNLMFTQLHGAV